MKRNIMAYLMMLAGLIAIASSLYSVQPASDYHYAQLLERDSLNPGSVTNDEWLESDFDLRGVFLLIFGVASFIFTTGISILIMLGMDVKKLTTVGYALSVVWIVLGAALHAFVWLI